MKIDDICDPYIATALASDFPSMLVVFGLPKVNLRTAAFKYQKFLPWVLSYDLESQGLNKKLLGSVNTSRR